MEQLLAVLPPFSSHALPLCLRALMESGSEIEDFYPRDFYVDLKGKRVAWLGEVILPFIDDERLKKAILKLEEFFDEGARNRNKRGFPIFLKRVQDSVSIKGRFEEIKARSVFNLEKYVNCKDDLEKVEVYKFEIFPSKEHLSVILEDCIMPKKSFYVQGKLSKKDLKLVQIVLNNTNTNELLTTY